MTRRTVAALLALLGFGGYRYRRSLLARLLKLQAPRYAVSVQRHIPVPMPDGVRLFTDHYFLKATGDFPTILIRTPYGRGKEVALWGRYGLGELPAQRFAERGYHVIVQGAWSRNLGAGEPVAAGSEWPSPSRPSTTIMPISRRWSCRL